MKIQINCRCGSKITIYSLFWGKLVKKYIDRFFRDHCHCHEGFENEGENNL
jgi:hypothetical protein